MNLDITEEERRLLEYRVDIPSGCSGRWRIDRYTLTQRGVPGEHDLIMNMIAGMPDRSVPPGVEYTRLMRIDKNYRQVVVMTDTPAEVREHLEAIDAAHGHVLITGLGIGMVAAAMLRNTLEVERVTVVEQSKDVLDLVAPTLFKRFGRRRLEVVNASAYEWDPGERRFAFAWHDIWDDISDDNLPQMAQLKAKYAAHVVGAQACWAEDQCRRMKHTYKAIRQLGEDYGPRLKSLSVVHRVALLKKRIAQLEKETADEEQRGESRALGARVRC